MSKKSTQRIDGITPYYDLVLGPIDKLRDLHCALTTIIKPAAAFLDANEAVLSSALRGIERALDDGIEAVWVETIGMRDDPACNPGSRLLVAAAAQDASV